MGGIEHKLFMESGCLQEDKPFSMLFVNIVQIQSK